MQGSVATAVDGASAWAGFGPRRAISRVALLVILVGAVVLSGFTSLVGFEPAGSGIAFAGAGSDTLYPNEVLYANQSLFADRGRYQLIMQADGNFLLYGQDGGTRVYWKAPTYGCQNAYAVMQWDGNLVVYSSNCGPWATGTDWAPDGVARLQLKSNSDLIVTPDGSQRYWYRNLMGGRPLIDNSDTWNPAGFTHNDQCVKLKNDNAPSRYSDWSFVAPADPLAPYDSPPSPYRFRNNQPLGSPCTSTTGAIRLDAQEILTTTESTPHRLYFHRGGQLLGDGTNIPYGHIWIGDLASAPSPRSSGPPEAGSQGAGKGCAPWGGDGISDPDQVYSLRADANVNGNPSALPADWQYKIMQTGSEYHKYQSAGEREGDRTRRYGYLSWSWVMRTNRSDTPTGTQNPYKMPDSYGNERATNDSGGVVRSLLKDGQLFYRCGNVKSITALAWGQNALKDDVNGLPEDGIRDDPVGRVTAIYGKTRPSSTAPWVYGWAVLYHQVKVDRVGENVYDGNYDNNWGPPIWHVY